MLTLAVPLVFLSVVAVLLLATLVERRMHIASARMTVGPRWSPEEAEVIVATELANLFTRQEAVSRNLGRRPRRSRRRAAAG